MQKRLFNFRQVNGIPLGDNHKEFKMLAKVAFKEVADLVTMKHLERKRKAVYPTIQMSFLNNNQKLNLFNII